MSRIRYTLLAAAAVVLTALPLAAQVAPPPAPATRPSPTDVAAAVVEGDTQTGKRVSVIYSRPFTKAPRSNEIRKIWGTLVPWNTTWRLGANEATLLITEVPLTFGTTTIPAGAYSLFMLPVENGPSKLIINKQIGQLGTSYDDKQDLARIDLKKDALTTDVDQFTIAITPKTGGGGGTLKLAWEKTQYSVDFTVKK